MKRQLRMSLSIGMILLCTQLLAQQGSVQAVFKRGVNSGGYGALTNKFTMIRGK